MQSEAGVLATAIGERVRRERHGRRWTLERLAEASGVSRRMLVSIEQGAANPSIATLLRVADALAVGLPVLVAPPERPESVRVTRGVEAPVLWTGDAGGRAVLVTGSSTPEVAELWDWTLGPGERYGSEGHAPGTVELLQVQQGTMTLEVGSKTLLLPGGDAARFDGSLAHAYANASSEPARFVLAVVEPRVQATRSGTAAG